MKKVLDHHFLKGETVTVARALLGKYLVRRFRSEDVALMINEVEAYDGPHDLASHAARGMTARNAIMFGPAGFWYIYLVYGMHWMLNIVTGSEDYPAAVLIRGVGLSNGFETGNYNGPAKLTKALKIDSKINGLAAIIKSGLWIENRGLEVKESDILSLPRIGVSYAGPIWSKKKYRFKYLI